MSSDEAKIAVLETKVTSLIDESRTLEQRIAAIERRQWIWTGGGLAIGALFGMFGQRFLLLFNGGSQSE